MNDRIFATYVFCMDYHAGQASRLYRVLSRIVSHYKPRLSDRAIQAIQDGGSQEWAYAHEIYKGLVRQEPFLSNR